MIRTMPRNRSCRDSGTRAKWPTRSRNTFSHSTGNGSASILRRRRPRSHEKITATSLLELFLRRPLRLLVVLGDVHRLELRVLARITLEALRVGAIVKLAPVA